MSPSRSALEPIVPVLLLGLLFAACDGEAPDTAAPGEASLALGSQAAVVAAAVPAAPDDTANIFGAPAAPMVALRSRHTASLLANGTVLAAGGTDGTTPLASAELFNPATGVWTSTAAMAQAREQQAAVVLSNGTVLVTGGLGAGGALTGVELYDPLTSTWTTGAPMAQARARHTITRLSSGNVLVLGGTDGAVSLASGELYDPVANTWTATAPLHQARARHTTTLLTDGRILVVGGSDDLGGSLATSEILSATKGTWSFGAPLATARTRHTATLLADGSLLVVGGVGTSGFLASVERYAPGTNLWTPAGTMVEARADHTALIAPLGHVIVAGGQGLTGPLATSEVYEPVPTPSDYHAKYTPKPWFSTGSMSSARADHTVTLLGNGKALHAGGAATATSELFDDSPGGLGTACSQPGQCGSGFCSHGVCCNTACTEQCRTCDPTGTCVDSPLNSYCTYSSNSCSIKYGMCSFGACLAVLTSGTNCLTQATGYYCATSTCSTFGSGCAGDVSPNGFVPGYACNFANPSDQTPCTCVAGNLTPTSSVSKLGLACATSATCGANVCVDGLCIPACVGSTCWSPEGQSKHARFEHTATLLPSGKLLFAGGQDEWSTLGQIPPHGLLPYSEIYDPVTSTWALQSMAAAHYGHTATMLAGGEVLVLGGATVGASGTYYVYSPGTIAERYDPASNAWTLTGSLRIQRQYHTATLLPGGEVLVLGGNIGYNTPGSSAEIYAPATGTSTIAAPMPVSRAHHTATLLPSGRVLVVGGTSSTEVDLYDPATDTWSLTAPLPTARSLHTATTLSNGKILVTGGDLGQPGKSAIVYDPAADTWAPAASMAAARADHAATIVSNGDVIVAGGGVGAERYDPLTDTWAKFGSMVAPNRHGNTTTLLPDGRLLVGFGLRSTDGIRATVNVGLMHE